MNALTMAKTAYGATAAPTRTPRGIEFDAIARVTRQLHHTASLGPSHYPQFVTALHQNRRLWTLLAGEVAGSDNELPQDLRARIFYLAEFTIQHSSKVLARKASIAPLLEINRAILSGLQSRGAAR